MAKKRKNRKKKNTNDVEVMTEEDFFGFDFIAGFTPGGIPFGISSEEADKMELDLELTKEQIKVQRELGLNGLY